jgi:hypothetical protein
MQEPGVIPIVHFVKTLQILTSTVDLICCLHIIIVGDVDLIAGMML